MNPPSISKQEVLQESLFLMAFPLARRVVAVRSAAATTIAPMTWADGEDVEQEAMIALWQALAYYDASRASLRTFAERVVANRLMSVLRGVHAVRRNCGCEAPLDEFASTLSASNDRVDLRVDVERVLTGVTSFDRAVALCLLDRSAVETSRCLQVSRAATYRAIRRLRLAFISAGMRPASRQHRARGARG
ncbi:MAG: sigma-70 family RNA polymerase sigma factor [Acidobacteriia bacterium]|nr:sigma-70 family RNA polymerase sigma factor [Terriglobia bacterium]